MLLRFKKTISFIVMFVLLIGIIPISSSQKTQAAEAFYIYTVDDLNEVRFHLDGTFYLMNNLDLSSATAEGGAYDYGGRGWKPIGISDDYSSYSYFTGRFYGNNHVIEGMRIDFITNSIENLSVGLFAGNKGYINDLSIGGNINAGGETSHEYNHYYNHTYIGGVTGDNDGFISNCKNFSAIKGNSSYAVGGIVGLDRRGNVTRCVNEATIDNSINDYGSRLHDSYTGGISGKSEYGTTKSYNKGDIKGSEGAYLGDSSYAYAYASGIDSYDARFSNSGYRGSDNYNLGKVTLSSDYYSRLIPLRGKCVYNLESNNNYILNDKGVKISLTSENMKVKSNYTGFDFDDTWVMSDAYAYKYPQLKDNMQSSKEISSVEIINTSLKTRYYTFDKMKLDGGKVKVYYADGESNIMDITKEMLQYDIDNDPYYYTRTTGKKNVYIYPDKNDNPTKSCSFEIEVVARPTAIVMTLLSEPNKKVFVQNTSFDFTGCQVQISYDNGDTEIRDIDATMTTGGSISTIGTQTIQYKLNSLSVQFTIEVVPLSVSSIKVENKPNKLTYLEGKDFDPTGMIVRAYLNDGSDRLVDDYTYSGYSSEPGTYTITVEYSGCKDTFDVVVNEKTATSIKVTKNPTKTSYVQGQEVDPEGMEVTAHYNNGTDSVIDGYTIDKPTIDTGVQTVAVRYGGLTTYIPITIIARQATGLFVTSPPNKTTYIEGTDFDDTGLVIAASFNDEITESVEGYELAGVDTSTVGNKVVTVIYQGLTTTFDINIVAKTLESIRITDKGKDSYLVGEEFDTSDLVVEANYDNGTHTKITDYEVSGFTGEVGDNVITVNYQGKKINYVVKVHEPDDDWTITKEPTCTDNGEKVKYCKHCGEVAIKEEIDKLGHTAVPDLAKEATCTESGLTAGSHCDTCEEILVAQEVIPAKGHTPSEEWEMIKDSTCLDEGSQVRRCAVCHEIVDTNAIAAKGHKLVTDEAVEATCTESGLTEGLHCEVCDEVIQAQTIIQPLGHIEAEEWTVTKAPTCTVAGTKVKKCTVCGHILKTEIIDPTGHSFKNYVSNNDATCTEDGTKTAKCEHCSETKTITDVNSAKGHKVVYDKAVAATCTESGLTAGSHCSECHEILQRQEVIAPKGHTASSKWVIAKQPTCTEKGIEVCQCVECDEVLDSRKIEAKGHTEVVDATVVATCTESGLTAGSHCHVCGEILVAQEVIPAKGHKEVIDKSVDATCEKTGLTQGSHCEVCGEVLKKQEIIPAKGHNVELKHVSKATYFDEGNTGDEVCNICGQVLKRGKTINKLQVPKPIVKFKKGKKRITLKFTKQKNITKYEIRIKKGKKWKVYYTSKSSYKIKKLKKKRKYTVKVRAMIVRGKDIAYSRYILKKVKTK